MISKKVIRYYCDCGKGFWKKEKCLSHEENCKSWKNPKFKSCLTCKFKNIITDSNGMELEPFNLETWQTNLCEHSTLGVPVHKDFNFIRKYCSKHELNNGRNTKTKGFETIRVTKPNNTGTSGKRYDFGANTGANRK